jgi:hypothetical protein
MKMADSSGNGIFNLRIRKTGGYYVLEVGNYANQTNPYSAPSAPFSIDLNTWYCVELQGHIGTSTGWFKALWNGIEKINQSSKDTGTTQIQRVNVGVEYCWLSNPCDIYVDCVVVSNKPIGCE